MAYDHGDNSYAVHDLNIWRWKSPLPATDEPSGESALFTAPAN
ncbi:hypothetical protein [Mycobacterium lentiflavum]|nr:hypothetical protein [Mycobacterium lentiflavum]